MPRAKQGTPTAGFRHVTLLDRRGQVLAFADSLAIRGHTVGLTRASFSPAGAVRLMGGRGQVTVTAGGRVVLVLTGLHLGIHTGEQRAHDGTSVCEAAIGTITRVERRRV